MTHGWVWHWYWDPNKIQMRGWGGIIMLAVYLIIFLIAGILHGRRIRRSK